MTKTLLAVTGLAALLAQGAGAATTHTVVKGDHLWGLAGHYHQNHFRWQAIYAANRDKIKDPHWIYPGQVLAIPDLPSPAVGELPAQPIPEKEVAAAPEPEPEAEPAPPLGRTDDLSTRMPEGQAGQYPSMVRVEMDRSWKEDGRITEFDGREIVAATGDRVVGVLEEPAEAGAQYEVFRKAAPQELDEDPKARHLQRVGLIKVEESLGKNRYRFFIVRSMDAVEAGDVLKKRS